jgi:hypothetical protein
MSKIAQLSHPGGRILLRNRKQLCQCHRVGHSWSACILWNPSTKPANIGVPEDEAGQHDRRSVGSGQRR